MSFATSMMLMAAAAAAQASGGASAGTIASAPQASSSAPQSQGVRIATASAHATILRAALIGSSQSSNDPSDPPIYRVVTRQGNQVSVAFN